MDGADCIKYIIKNNIEGDIVECGVADGKYEYIWINELRKHNHAIRDIYLYDTFGGLTQPSKYDYTCNDAILYNMNNEQVYNTWKKQIINNNTNGWCYVPVEHVKQKLFSTGYPKHKLHFIIGDVMETLKNKNNIPNKISVLRLDTDWYESSKFELEQMYDNVVKDGVIIFDDYYHWNGQRKATDDFFIDRNLKYNMINIGNNKTGAIIKK